MSDLIIVAFRSQDTAFVAGEALVALQQDAGPSRRTLSWSPAMPPAGCRSTSRSILPPAAPGRRQWGMLIGMLFLDKRKLKSESAGLAAQFRDSRD